MNFTIKQVITLLFIGMVIILLSSCGAKEGEEVIICDPVEAKVELNLQTASGDYIFSITQNQDQYSIVYNNGVESLFCFDVIEDYTFNTDLWTARINFSDGSSLGVPSIGNITTDFEHNPFNRNPLCALATINTKRTGKIRLTIKGKFGDSSDFIHSFDELNTNFELPVFGLYQDYENVVEIAFLTGANQIVDIDTLFIPTPKLEKLDPVIEIIEVDRANMEPGEFHLVSSLSYWGPNIAYMFDTYGEIRWLVDYKEEENLNNLFFDVGMEQLQNGNLYFGDKISNAIYEVDFFGNIIHSWPLVEHTFHHNVVEKPDGNFLVTVNRPESQHLNGKSTKQDYVIEIDRSTGAIVKEWDFKQLMDENRTVLGPWLDETPIDWIHINAVVYSEVDNTIIISGRHQGLAKIDYQDNVKWILAPHNGWEINRMNQDCAQFLLAAINDQNVPYEDEVQRGFENAIDFEWPWYQHAPELMPNGNLLVFDNGSERNFISSNSKYSRAVEYTINEEQKTVQQVWNYGKERGNEAFADVLSDVDYLPKTGNILFAPGMRVLHNGEFKGGRIIEVDYHSKEVYFEAHIGSSGLTFHRVERLSFY